MVKSTKTSFCLKVMAFLALTSAVQSRRYSKTYQYYNTREDYPVPRANKPTHTKSQIDSAWIPVPWSHGGNYWHNTLTREDRDSVPSCLAK